jgi:tetratricopeptide (TPR) repeat protein
LQTADQLTFQRAVQSFRSGALGEAEKNLTEFLQRNPNHLGALNLYGILLIQLGRHAEAETVLRKAIKLDQRSDTTFYNYGIVLQALNRPKDALAAFEKAVAINPTVAETWNSKGAALNALKRYREAVSDFQQAIRLNPRFAEAHYNLGRAFAELEAFDQAIAAYDAAIRLKPDFVEALLNHGLLLNDLRRYAPALANYDRALALRPNLAEALEGRGRALQGLKRYGEALPAYEQALALRPGDADGLLNQGSVLHELRRFDEALASYDRALAMRPDHVDTEYSRAVTLLAMERFEEARASLDRVLARVPDHVKASWAKCQLLLTLGQFAEGWELHDYRWSGSIDGYRAAYGQPRWTGEPVAGTLLIWGEQGLGEQILQAGVVGEAMARAQRTVIEIEPRLVPLYARSFPGATVVAAKPPALYGGHVDAQVAICDLPRIFRRSWDDFPRRDRGFLIADAERVRELRGRLARDGRAVVGLSWFSRNPIVGDYKSVPLRELEPLLRNPRCRFVDLQYGDTSAERAVVLRELGIEVEHLDDIDNSQDIDGLAALISACDAVVTVSNTTAHLAGGIGRPTWVMLPFGHSGFWYWFRGRPDSPWFPQVRVVRKTVGQTWSALAQIVADEMQNLIARISRIP